MAVLMIFTMTTNLRSQNCYTDEEDIVINEALTLYPVYRTNYRRANEDRKADKKKNRIQRLKDLQTGCAGGGLIGAIGTAIWFFFMK